MSILITLLCGIILVVILYFIYNHITKKTDAVFAAELYSSSPGTLIESMTNATDSYDLRRTLKRLGNARFGVENFTEKVGDQVGSLIKRLGEQKKEPEEIKKLVENYANQNPDTSAWEGDIEGYLNLIKEAQSDILNNTEKFSSKIEEFNNESATGNKSMATIKESFVSTVTKHMKDKFDKKLNVEKFSELREKLPPAQQLVEDDMKLQNFPNHFPELSAPQELSSKPTPIGGGSLAAIEKDRRNNIAAGTEDDSAIYNYMRKNLHMNDSSPQDMNNLLRKINYKYNPDNYYEHVVGVKKYYNEFSHLTDNNNQDKVTKRDVTFEDYVKYVMKRTEDFETSDEKLGAYREYQLATSYEPKRKTYRDLIDRAKGESAPALNTIEVTESTSSKDLEKFATGEKKQDDLFETMTSVVSDSHSNVIKQLENMTNLVEKFGNAKTMLGNMGKNVDRKLKEHVKGVMYDAAMSGKKF